MSGDPPKAHLAQDFQNIDCWIFDLDNTLYPAHCNLFAQIDQRMGAFICDRIGLPQTQAKALQKKYYRDYGTTMNGLMQEHGIDPSVFLDYVHDIDLSPVEPDAKLEQALAHLPGKKFVFTNASTTHAENVMDRLGVAHHFHDIFDIACADYVPKPAHETYLAFIEQTIIKAETAAMFEDLSRNLKAPHDLGMRTILVESGNHPDEGFWPEPEDDDHIHHVTDDLGGFLSSLFRQ